MAVAGDVAVIALDAGGWLEALADFVEKDDHEREPALMLTVPEAVAQITAGITPRNVERVRLLDSLGLVLAKEARAPYTLPAMGQLGHGRLRRARRGH